MTQAESTKALLCVEDFKDAIIPDNTGTYCCENLEKGGNYLAYLKHKIIFCYESITLQFFKKVDKVSKDIPVPGRGGP
jgi:hypothetical protein